MDHTTWARNFFKDDIFATQTTGITIEKADTNYAKCSLTIEPKHLNAANNVMGGVLFTLADFTFAVASNVNTQGTITVSLSSNIEFLGTLKGTALFSEARCIKNGRTTSYFEITITDDLGTLIAHVTATGFKKSLQS